MSERNKENQIDEIFYGQWFELSCKKEEIERCLQEKRKELAHAKDIDKQHDLDSRIFELEHELESLRVRDKELIDAYKSHTTMIASLEESSETIEKMQPHVERGERIKEGALHSHQIAHGTPEQKATRWKHFKDECLKVHDETPRWGLTAIRQEVADRTGYSLKTIERHTKNLRNLIDPLS